MRILLVSIFLHFNVVLADNFRIFEQPMDRFLYQRLKTGFSEHAREQVGSDGNGVELSLIAKSGYLFAGAVVADTLFGALHIKSLFIEPKWRGQGLGKVLMKSIMQKGKERGCRFAYVETMNFQAVDFYKKMGFKEEFVRSGYDNDCQYHYLKVEL